MLLQLKTFQNIGYFIDLDQIPQAIVIYLRKQLGVPHNTQLSLWRQQLSIDITNRSENIWGLLPGTEGS